MEIYIIINTTENLSCGVFDSLEKAKAAIPELIKKFISQHDKYEESNSKIFKNYSKIVSTNEYDEYMIIRQTLNTSYCDYDVCVWNNQ